MLFISLNVLLFISSFTNNRTIFKNTFFMTACYCSMSFGRGFDWINYYDVYQNVELYDAPFEPGYLNVLRTFNWLGFSYPMQNFVVVLFLFYCVYVFVSKTQNPSLAFFTIFCFMGHYILSEQIRQAIAICIILLFFDFFIKRKVLKGTVVIALAMCFHISAVFCFIYFFIVNTNAKYSNVKFSIYCSVFLLVSYYMWSNPAIISTVPILYNKFVSYTEAYTEGFISIERIISSKVVMIYIFLLCLSIWLLKKYNLKSLNGSIKALVFMTLSKLTIFFGRFQYYMVPILILGFDEYFAKYKIKNKVNVHRLIYASCLFIISLVPLWTPSTFESINDSLYFNASPKEIESGIMRRCKTLNHYDPQNGAIWRCK